MFQIIVTFLYQPFCYIPFTRVQGKTPSARRRVGVTLGVFVFHCDINLFLNYYIL